MNQTEIDIEEKTEEEKEWNYDELENIYFKQSKINCQCPSNRVKRNINSTLDDQSDAAQAKYLEKHRFLRDLQLCLNWKADNQTRNVYKRLIDIGYDSQWLNQFNDYKDAQKWSKSKTQIIDDKTRREKESILKVEQFLASEFCSSDIDKEENQDQKISEINERSITVTVESIDQIQQCPDFVNHQKIEQDKIKINQVQRANSVAQNYETTFSRKGTIPRFDSVQSPRNLKNDDNINFTRSERNSIFSDVGDLSHIDKGRRTQARMQDLEKRMRSAKTHKSNYVIPKSHPKIELDTIERDKKHGNRADLFVSYSNQIMANYLDEKYKLQGKPSSNIRVSQGFDQSTKQSSNSSQIFKFNDTSIFTPINFLRNTKNFQK